jgi:polyphosphate kinase 2 (PPK2 family)
MSKPQSDDVQPKMTRKEYEKELRKLQTELCLLQDWIVHAGLRVVVVFEGRDAAGKGGTIKAITERVSPRVFRLVALPAPSDRERTQVHAQRYFQHFPAAGEVVIFDRSWYNRAGVEYVMGFCTSEQYKASMMDLQSYAQWYEFSRARDLMLEATDTKEAPWYVVRSDDKRRARLNCISHLLSRIDYKEVPREKVALPKRSHKGEYDDQAKLVGRTFVPEKY